LNGHGQRNLGCAIEKAVTEKRRKIFFVFFQNKHIFQEEVNKNHRKCWAKTRCPRKTNVVSETSEDGPSSHSFISISKIQTKIDFFGVGDALNHSNLSKDNEPFTGCLFKSFSLEVEYYTFAR